MVNKVILEKINSFIESILSDGISIEKVILYGSYSKGNENKDSDIDIAVISKDFGFDNVEEGMNLFRIAGEIDTRIEPVPLSIEDYENNTWIPLIYEIRKTGIEIYR